MDRQAGTADLAAGGTTRQVARPHAHENQRLFRALVGKRSGQVVMAQFRELVIDLVREDLVSVGPAGPTREAAVRLALQVARR